MARLVPAPATSMPASATRTVLTMESFTTSPQLPTMITYPRLPRLSDGSDDERWLTASDSSCSSEDLAKSLGPTPSYEYDYPESILQMGREEMVLKARWLDRKMQVPRTQESRYDTPDAETTPQGSQQTAVSETDYGSSGAGETTVTGSEFGSFDGDGTTTYITAHEYQPTPASQISSFNPNESMDLDDLPAALPQEPLFSTQTVRMDEIAHNSSFTAAQGAETFQPGSCTKSEFSDLWTDSRHERQRRLNPSAYSTPRTPPIAAFPSPHRTPQRSRSFSSPPSPSPKTLAALDSILMPPPSAPASQLSQPGSITGRTQPKNMREASQCETLSLHESFKSGLFIDKNMRNINQLAADDPKWGIRPFEEVKHLYPKNVEGLIVYLKEHCEKDPHCPNKRLGGHEGFWVRAKKGTAKSNSGTSANMNGWGIGK